MSYNLLEITEFKSSDVNFDLPNNINNKICCNNILQNIYQTPKLVNKSKIYVNDNVKYIDVLVNDNDFYKFLRQIDESVLNETRNKNSIWFRKELSEKIINDYYKSIIKSNNNEKYVTFKINDKSKIYNENNEIINYEEIDEYDNVILLITLSNIVFEQNSFYINIIANHIKVYKQKLSLTEMIKTNNILDNEIINNLASNKINNDYDENDENLEEDEYENDSEDDNEEEYEDNNENLDNYEISSRMIVNKKKELKQKYDEAENASINAHNLRKQAIELAQELEDYESIKTEMN